VLWQGTPGSDIISGNNMKPNKCKSFLQRNIDP
jgi:hypothetical protein